MRDQLYQSGREQSLGARASRWLHSADWLQAPGGDGGGSLAGTLYIGVTQAQRDKVGARAVDCIGLACKIRIIRFFFYSPFPFFSSVLNFLPRGHLVPSSDRFTGESLVQAQAAEDKMDLTSKREAGS